MLHDLIVANRDLIIERARRRLSDRVPQELDANFEYGIPLFLTQLARALLPDADATLHLVGAAATSKRIGDSASRHGEDLLRNGFSVAQVVHGYGDVCQIVTELAAETDVSIGNDEFHVFNRCLDDAIAGAVTAHGRQREQDRIYEGTERLGVLAHELRNFLQTAALSFDAMKKGTVGVGGSTGALHSRTLSGMSALVERTLAEVRLEAGPPVLERVSALELVRDITLAASMQADGRGLELTITSPEASVMIDADRQLLLSALWNLLQNAFKFTRPEGKITLVARATADRVLFQVSDECGGLPPGGAERMLKPFRQLGSDRSGLGLGLSIAQRAVRANKGELYVHDTPGTGCTFTIDVPSARPS